MTKIDKASLINNSVPRDILIWFVINFLHGTSIELSAIIDELEEKKLYKHGVWFILNELNRYDQIKLLLKMASWMNLYYPTNFGWHKTVLKNIDKINIMFLNNLPYNKSVIDMKSLEYAKTKSSCFNFWGESALLECFIDIFSANEKYGTHRAYINCLNFIKDYHNVIERDNFSKKIFEESKKLWKV